MLRWKRDHKRPFFARVFARARFSCEFSGKFSDKPPDKFSGGPKAAPGSLVKTKKSCENVSSQLYGGGGLSCWWATLEISDFVQSLLVLPTQRIIFISVEKNIVKFGTSSGLRLNMI